MDIAGESHNRVATYGHQLIDIHNGLREELVRLRDDVDHHLTAGGDRPRDLRVHCLAFCSAIRGHHTDEDSGVFRVIARRHPELGSVIGELERDHRIVADMLSELEGILAAVSAEPGPVEARRLRAELDGLTALLESHFAYEEKKLVAALDAVDTRTGPQLFRTP
jgi:iron-sulfur cluster repair protein YtfE (RIC family)